MIKKITIEPKAPILITSCKKFSKKCCADQRDTAWRKNRKQNKQYLREAFYIEN